MNKSSANDNKTARRSRKGITLEQEPDVICETKTGDGQVNHGTHFNFSGYIFNSSE
jgi:hypothetical protein